MKLEPYEGGSSFIYLGADDVTHLSTNQNVAFSGSFPESAVEMLRFDWSVW